MTERDVWTVQRIMEWTQAWFSEHGINSPRLDTEVLLAHVLGKDRVYLYTHYDRPLSSQERDAFRVLVKRRAKREPVAYILGEKEFYGRPFKVTQDTLVPRPETEHLIDGVVKWVAERRAEGAMTSPCRILDLGTGTGCIAITLAAELSEVEVTAVDISGATLAVARENARTLGVSESIQFREGDLFAPVMGERFDIIVSNPPYVEEKVRAALEPEVTEFEPAGALFAGNDGMEIIRRLIPEAVEHLVAGGLLAVEFGSTQRAAMEGEMGQPWAKFWIEEDLQGHPRALFAERS